MYLSTMSMFLAEVFEVSAETGEGLAPALTWLIQQLSTSDEVIPISTSSHHNTFLRKSFTCLKRIFSWCEYSSIRKEAKFSAADIGLEHSSAMFTDEAIHADNLTYLWYNVFVAWCNL